MILLCILYQLWTLNDLKYKVICISFITGVDSYAICYISIISILCYVETKRNIKQLNILMLNKLKKLLLVHEKQLFILITIIVFVAYLIYDFCESDIRYSNSWICSGIRNKQRNLSYSTFQFSTFCYYCCISSAWSIK